MKPLIYILLSFVCVSSYAQIFIGQVNDENNKPVQYANIGVLGKNRGTVSDVNGKFQINLNNCEDHDTLRFSCIGYEKVDFRLIDLKNIKEDTIKIQLTKKAYQIQEVLIEPSRYKVVKLGNAIKNTDNRIRSDSELGSEIGIIIKPPNKKESYFLRSFSFSLADHNFSSEARINIYNLKNGLPKETILKTPIYTQIQVKDAIVNIDLSDYSIQIKKDFFISLEHFKKSITKENRLKFFGIFKPFKGKNTDCLMRKTSHGEWIRIPHMEVQFQIEAVVYK